MKRFWVLTVCLLLTVVMVASMTSCAVKISAEELSAGYERKVTETPTVDDDFRGDAAEFAFDLLKNIPMEEGENALLSPLSALACLGMITGGADGETLRQLEEALGMDEETLTKSLYAYISGLYTGENCKFSIANSIWTKKSDDRFRVNEDFLQKNADWYGAEVYRAPFDDSTVKDINLWVEKHTDGMIDEIIKELSPETVMILINALVFDAKWQEKYEKSDIDKYTFTAYDGTKTKVDMMNSGESVYLELDGAIGFAKNYEGGKYSFVGLLPEEGKDIYEFARAIDGEAFLEMWDHKSYRSVNARIPEFSYEDRFSLKETLQTLGVTDLFDASEADLSALGSYEDGNLFCSAIEQKTFIDVSREGTKAAAVTWGVMDGASAAPSEVINIFLDRPFVYAIVDNATGLPLFVGVVANIAK